MLGLNCFTPKRGTIQEVVNWTAQEWLGEWADKISQDDGKKKNGDEQEMLSNNM